MVAIIDGIISNPGAHIPWEDLVGICKDKGVWSVVDGAHLIGQVEINVRKADPDFFVSVSEAFLEIPLLILE